MNISTVGTSQVIDPAGHTIDSLPLDEPGAMVTDVELRTGLTPSVVLGGAVPLIVVLGSLAALIAAGVIARQKARRNDGDDVAEGSGRTEDDTPKDA